MKTCARGIPAMMSWCGAFNVGDYYGAVDEKIGKHLNVLYAVTLYNQLKRGPNDAVTPRTVLFGGKAAPGFSRGKRTTVAALRRHSACITRRLLALGEGAFRRAGDLCSAATLCGRSHIAVCKALKAFRGDPMSNHPRFAARPSGTEDVYKLYAESFRGLEHLQRIQKEAQALISGALAGAME